LMQTSGVASPSPTGAVENTANASPRVRTVCRSSGGVRGSDRRNATNRSFAVVNCRARPGTKGMTRAGTTRRATCLAIEEDRWSHLVLFASKYATDQRLVRGPRSRKNDRRPACFSLYTREAESSRKRTNGIRRVSTPIVRRVRCDEPHPHFAERRSGRAPRRHVHERGAPRPRSRAPAPGGHPACRCCRVRRRRCV